MNSTNQFKGATGGGRMLSEHFSEFEFVYSDTAIRLGIMNVPDSEQVSNMKKLCALILEPARKAIGDKPIVITSGFRRTALNKAVGGVSTSQHTLGQAADIKPFKDEATNKAFIKSVSENPYLGQLLYEHTKNGASWFHVSIDINRPPRHYIDLHYKVKYKG